MSKKKILVFVDWYLPGFKAGGPIRSCANLISHFSNEYDFFVLWTSAHAADHAVNFKEGEYLKCVALRVR